MVGNNFKVYSLYGNEAGRVYYITSKSKSLNDMLPLSGLLGSGFEKVLPTFKHKQDHIIMSYRTAFSADLQRDIISIYST